jgi:hypothetical protein
MSTSTDQLQPGVHPRPGVLKTLGICNIVFSVLGGLCILWSVYFLIAMAAIRVSPQPVQFQVQVKAQAQQAPKAGVPVTATFNPFMGMNDPSLIRFSYVENGASILLNLLMFVTGIGLLNSKRWAARWWTVGACAKIAVVVVLWSYYIVAVAPTFSANMARYAEQMLAQQPAGRGGAPNVAFLTRVYQIMNLIVAVGTMLIASIYPAISLWLLSRPGVKAAIVDKPATEPELP